MEIYMDLISNLFNKTIYSNQILQTVMLNYGVFALESRTQEYGEYYELYFTTKLCINSLFFYWLYRNQQKV